MKSITSQVEKTGRGKAAATQESLDLNTPYYFPSAARLGKENLEIGDCVKITGLDRTYQLIDIFPEYGSVRVRPIGGRPGEGLLTSWHYVSPCKLRSKALTRAIGNWLFRGSRVYLISEPRRMLRTVRVDWDKQTSDVQDSRGRIYKNVGWDRLEFWNPEDYRLADEE